MLDGPPQLLIAILLGTLEPDQAQARGLRHEGDIALLRRVQPRTANTTQADDLSAPTLA